MKRFVWKDLDAAARTAALARPGLEALSGVDAAVQDIFDRVGRDGDEALRELTLKFDGVAVAEIEVTDAEFKAAARAVPLDVQNAMAEARERLITWHTAGAMREFSVETAAGVSCGRIVRGIRRVGLYVPAGLAPLPSTALMLGVPAHLAGCEDVVLCTPPNRQGQADSSVLVAARLSGIKKVFKLGGAQAIAAIALGTKSVPGCDKLFGPGNSYVTRAKQVASMRPGGPAIDMPAGPSEVLVIADAGAPPAFVAADLLAQAEHGPDSQVILISDSKDAIDRVVVEVEAQLKALPRADIARKALAHARAIEVATIDDAFAVSNDYAPEHLILALRDAPSRLPFVRAAGSVFIGDYAPESLGDYCSGTNHVLPTGGAARGYSGVSVASFQNSISVQTVSPSGLRDIGPCAMTLARAEGLEAHAQAVVKRMEALQ